MEDTKKEVRKMELSEMTKQVEDALKKAAEQNEDPVS